MDLADIRAAITQVEGEMKRLRRQIVHRESEAANRQAEAEGLKRTLADTVERYVNLVAEEQKIVRPESVE